MKKVICLVWGIICFALTSQAQTYDTTSFYGKMNYLYANINKTFITTGLLRDYGIDFQNLDNYTGASLNDSNYTSLTDWRMLYASLYSQQITSTAGLLYLDTLNKRFNQYGIMGDPISFVTMYYNYQSIDPNGLEENQFYLENGQLFDVRRRNGEPYLMHSLFAIATTRQLAITGDNQFIFRNDLFFGNTGKTISSIQVDALGTGSYQTVSIGTAFTVHYDTAGLYNVNIQITYTDNTVKYAHTKLAVHEVPQARYGTGFTPATIETVSSANATIKPYLGVTGECTITIDLARNNATGQIRRPLIVVEGFDPDGDFGFNGSDGLVPRLNRDINFIGFTPITLNTELDDVNEYDLIFVNWQNGKDYIQRNAFLLESVIQLVNSRKTTWNGVRQDNVIIGMSMGGLVARYALRDMEQNSQNHETRLFISHDAPHNGANVPVAYQALVQYIAPWQVVNGIGGGFPFISWSDMFPDAVKAVNTFNSPAAKQMLMQRYLLQSTTGGTFSSQSYSLAADNAVHESFMTEINNMGWPINCRNITLANGSCNGATQFSDNSKMLSIYGEQSWTYFGSIWRSFAGIFGGILNATNIPTNGTLPINNNALLIQYPLSFLSSKTNLVFDFGAWSVPFLTGNSEIFRGDLYVKRKLFFGLFSTNTYIMKCHVSSSSEMLALDNAPGGVYDLTAFGFNIDKVNEQLHETLGSWINASVQEQRFCFVPTVSSLAFNDYSSYYRLAICNYANCHNPTQVANFFAPQQNQLHISYTQQNTNWIMQNIDPNFACAKICPANFRIFGSKELCTTETYNALNVPSGVTYSWSSMNGAFGIVSGQGTNQVTITKLANSIDTIILTLTNSCWPITPIKYGITVGTLYSTYNIIAHYPSVEAECFPANAFHYFEAVFTGGYQSNDFEWGYRLQGSTAETIVSGTGYIGGYFLFSSPGSYEVFVRPKNTCGVGQESMRTITVCEDLGGLDNFLVSPNPTSGEMRVATKENNRAKTTLYIKEIQVTDKFGKLKKRLQIEGAKQVTINIVELPADIYLIRIFDGRNWHVKKVVKM